ncbi:MAG TPA: hypothetical protein VHK69_01310 [Chitinophagaceae bacterium]|jgi:hypothetical protein|nr:hypothetical protein [Chitinophagaceae bacterium]
MPTLLTFTGFIVYLLVAPLLGGLHLLVNTLFFLHAMMVQTTRWLRALKKKRLLPAPGSFWPHWIQLQK